MPLTAAQTTAFFEQDAQMGIPNETVVRLQKEGITTVDDLVDFDKDTMEQTAANLRRPAGRIPDPNPGAAPGATIRSNSILCIWRQQVSEEVDHSINTLALLQYFG
jgi:hypothetical protein